MDRILASLKEGDPLYVVITVLLVSLAGYKKIFAFFDDVRHRRLKQIEELLENQYLDATMKGHLESQLNDEALKLSTGISVGKFYRIKLFELYEQANGDFSLRQVKLIQNYLALKDGKIDVKIYFVEWVVGVLSAVFGALAIASAYFLLIQINQAETALDYFMIFGGSLFSFAIGFIGFMQLFILLFAHKLKSVFEALQADDDLPNKE